MGRPPPERGKRAAAVPMDTFNIADWSVNEPFEGNWRAKVRNRIRQTDLTIVICGEHTDSARGVAAELTISREENKPYFLVRGRPNKKCKKPAQARKSDKIYKWTWDNLQLLVDGSR